MTATAEQQPDNLALNAELPNDDIEALLADAPGLANEMGLATALDLPAAQLWQQVKLNEHATSAYFVRQGFYLLKLQALTPHGEWREQIDKNNLDRRVLRKQFRLFSG